MTRRTDVNLPDTLADNQVLDDPALLREMMEHIAQCDELYKPTNYWAYYERVFLPELKQKGLRDFRRRYGSVLTSFGGTDLRPAAEVRDRDRSLHVQLMMMIYRVAVRRGWLLHRVHGLAWTTPYFFRYVKEKFARLGLELERCPTTLFGNPEDVYETGGGVWSAMHLDICNVFADAARYIAFRPDSVVCELGTGMGRNTEIMARLFGKATLFMFDIPPQLYVANQYLTAVFGERVIPYREAIALKPLPNGSIPRQAKGKIIILPSWKIPEWSKTGMDVFWNSASFQEMEPDVVLNYLRQVKSMSPEWVYINALPGGNYWGEWHSGQGGTREPVVEESYFEGLGDQYDLRHTYATDYFLREATDYRSYIFERNRPDPRQQ